MTSQSCLSLRLFVPALALSLLSLLSVQAGPPSCLFTDSFNYSAWNSGNNRMDAVWTQNPTTGAPSIISADATYPALATPHLLMSSRTLSVSLGQTLTSDFELTVNARATNYGTALWVGLFDATGTKGYGFRWDSSTADISGGNGSLRLVKFNASSSSAVVFNGSFGPTGTLGQYFASDTVGRPGQPASAVGSSVEFVTVKVTWVNATDTLVLHVGGSVVATITDASFSEFSTLIIGANGNQFRIGDVTVSTTAVPEPANVALGMTLMTAGCASVFACRKRARSR